MKPAVFIGSSVESLKIAYAVQEELAYDAEITVWSQGIFKLSSTALSDLLEALDKFDFSIFIFSPDDVVKIGEQEFLSTRDNVIFELGLFIGRLGRQRNFFVMPKDQSNFRLPSDLLGVTSATFDANRSDGNLQAALGPACNKIRESVAKLGKLKRAPVLPSSIPEQPEDSYYHIRVQRLITANGNADEPKFLYNQSKSAFIKIATNLNEGRNVQIAGEAISGFDLNNGFVSISILRSEERAKISALTGADSATRELFWDEVRSSDDTVDITAELDITDIYSNKTNVRDISPKPDKNITREISLTILPQEKNLDGNSYIIAGITNRENKAVSCRVEIRGIYNQVGENIKRDISQYANLFSWSGGSHNGIKEIPAGLDGTVDLVMRRTNAYGFYFLFHENPDTNWKKAGIYKLDLAVKGKVGEAEFIGKRLVIDFEYVEGEKRDSAGGFSNTSVLKLLNWNVEKDPV